MRLGEVLVDMKVITPEQLDEALADQKLPENIGKTVGEVLEEKKMITKEDIKRAVRLRGAWTEFKKAQDLKEA